MSYVTIAGSQEEPSRSSHRLLWPAKEEVTVKSQSGDLSFNSVAQLGQSSFGFLELSKLIPDPPLLPQHAGLWGHGGQGNEILPFSPRITESPPLELPVSLLQTSEVLHIQLPPPPACLAQSEERSGQVPGSQPLKHRQGGHRRWMVVVPGMEAQ